MNEETRQGQALRPTHAGPAKARVAGAADARGAEARGVMEVRSAGARGAAGILAGGGAVRGAVVLWAGAIVAGVAETVMAVAGSAARGGLGGDVWGQVGVRSLVFAGAAVLVVALAQGRNWARVALTVLLTGFGLGSLLVPAAMALAGGASFAGAFDGGHFGPGFLAVRLAHIACVIGASVLMYMPAANRAFARRRT